MKMHFLSFTKFLLIIIMSVLPVATIAAENSQMFFILDGSGSMWGDAGGQTKIEAAREVMNTLVPSLPPELRIGIAAYGHRRKGDCEDIEVLMHSTAGNRDELLNHVQSIRPKGKTPIADTIKLVVETVETDETRTVIVLVSDGKETCELDPCGVVRALKETGIDFILHAVGFGVRGEAVEQLQCIAQAGGGHYFQADDVSSLNDALTTVTQNVVTGKKLPPPLPLPALAPEVQKSETKRIRIAGPGTIVLKPAPWVKFPPYEWHAVDPETGEKNASARERDQLKVRKGEYQIVWRQTEHYSIDVPLTEIVHVPASKTAEVLIDTGLRIVTPENIKAPDYWSLVWPGDKNPFARFRRTLDPQVLPAGKYRLLWQQSEHYSPSVDFGVVNIKPGKLNEHILGSGIQIRRADWIAKAPYFIELVKADGTSLGQWRHAEGLQLVPPGKYSVLYRQTEHSYSTITLGEVSVPESGLANVTINSGVKFVTQADAKPPYKAIFVHLHSGKEFVWHGHFMGKWAPVPLPPGRYKLDWWEDKHGSERMTLLDEFVIESGTLVEMEM